MSRTRLIRPAFFKHGELYDAEVESGLPLRIAFAGLWSVTDREGRFVWKPRDLKPDVLPHDPVDMAEVLQALAKYGFVRRYVVDGKAYGHIPSFGEHQSFHKSEPPSKLPAPPVEHREDTVSAPVEHREDRADSVAVAVTGTVTVTGADNATRADRATRRQGKDPDTERLLEVLKPQLAPEPWADVERFLKSRKYKTWPSWLGEFSKLIHPGSQFTQWDLATACRDALAIDEPLTGPHALRAFIAKAREGRVTNTPRGPAGSPLPSPTESQSAEDHARQQLEERYSRQRRLAVIRWAHDHAAEYEKIVREVEALFPASHSFGNFGDIARQAEIDRRCQLAGAFPSFRDWQAPAVVASP